VAIRDPAALLRLIAAFLCGIIAFSWYFLGQLSVVALFLVPWIALGFWIAVLAGTEKARIPGVIQVSLMAAGAVTAGLGAYAILEVFVLA
jgi:hypothetical protein